MRLSTALALFVFLAPGVATAAPGGDRDPLQMLRQADADRDGRITRAEFIRSREGLFARLDRNGDGYAGREDLPRRAARRAGGERMQALAARLDADGDGRLSRREFVHGPSAFERVDSDRNGVVTATELDRAENALSHLRP